jgi:hypothetical protein
VDFLRGRIGSVVVADDRGTTLYFAGPVYHSDLKTDFSINNLVATWVGFALHLTWVLLALWYDHKVGGIGEYTHGKLGESLGDA